MVVQLSRRSSKPASEWSFKGDSSELECAVVDGVGQAGLSASQFAD